MMIDKFVESCAIEVPLNCDWGYCDGNCKLAISYYSYKRCEVLVESLLSIPKLHLSQLPSVSVVLQSYTSDEIEKVSQVLVALKEIESIDCCVIKIYDKPLGFRNAYLEGFFNCLTRLDCNYILTMDDDTLFTDRSDLDVVMKRMNLIPWIGVTRVMHEGSLQDYFAKDKGQVAPYPVNLPRGGPGMLYRAQSVIDVLNTHDLHDDNGVCYDLHFSTISYLLGWKTYIEPVISVLVNPKTPDMHFRPPGDWSKEGGFVGVYGSPESFERSLKEFFEKWYSLYRVRYGRNKAGVINFKTRYTRDLILSHRESCVDLIKSHLTDKLVFAWRRLINCLSVEEMSLNEMINIVTAWNNDYRIRPVSFEEGQPTEFSILTSSLGCLSYVKSDNHKCDITDFKYVETCDGKKPFVLRSGGVVKYAF